MKYVNNVPVMYK